MTDPAAARAWLDAERANLVAVAVHAADHGWPGHPTQLAAILGRYLEGGGHYPEAVTIHTRARRAARHDGDQAAEPKPVNVTLCQPLSTCARDAISKPPIASARLCA